MTATISLPARTSRPTPRLAISVSHLSKEYRVVNRGDRSSTAAEAALGRLRQPRRRRANRRLLALDDVSFDVPWGEILGIVGRNGAGKSTLLKILTRITAPTSGRACLAGRVGSLLEIGTGFHPELTGRENVFLNGTLLGMKKKEIQRRFDEIVAFAGVEEFLDTQVKRFSTGMYVRLAFGVAAHLDSEILVVDEVLAVGDADFQSKCLRKLREVANSGRTVLLVSHQLQTVATLATAGLYLEAGQVRYSGGIEAALNAYKQSFELSSDPDVTCASLRPGTGELRFDVVNSAQRVYEPQEEKTIEFQVASGSVPHGPLHLACQVLDSDRNVVAQCDSRLTGVRLEDGSARSGQIRIRGPWLKPGRYSVDMFLSSYAEIADYWENACRFEVVSTLPYPGTAPDWAIARAPVLTDFACELA